MPGSLVVLTLTTFVTWIGTRLTAVALPLVALAETGDAWTTGLVGGAAGLPLLTVGRWGRRLRERIVSGRALAVVLLVQAAGLVVVPVAAATVGVGAAVLCASGLVTGAAGALGGPAQRALTSDLADAAVEDGATTPAARWLSWQDLARRVSMIFAPPFGAWLVATWGAGPLLWCEAAALLAGAAAVLTVPAVGGARRATGGPTAVHDPPPTVRQLFAARPDVAVGVVLTGVGGLAWFAFSLGLALLGAELDRPGALVAAGMSGYGAASLAVSFVVPAVVDRLPRVATVATSCVVVGLSFVALPLVAPDLLLIGAAAALGGAAMPLGITALNALISEQTAGAERRLAFTVEMVLHSVGASLGLLLGGGLIGRFGAGPVLVAAGAAQVLAAVVGVAWVAVGHGHRRPWGGARHVRDARADPGDRVVAGVPGTEFHPLRP